MLVAVLQYSCGFQDDLEDLLPAESDLVVAILAIETFAWSPLEGGGAMGGASDTGDPEGASKVGRFVGFVGEEVSSSLEGADRLRLGTGR